VKVSADSLGKSLEQFIVFQRRSVVEEFTLEISKRTEKGSSSSRRLRTQGKLPGVVYSHNQETISAYVDYKSFNKIAVSARGSQVFFLKSSDPELNGRHAIVKAVQKDYVKGHLFHVDFQALLEDEEISLLIPIKIEGESVGVKNDGGILAISLREIELTCLPAKIPSQIVVNISHLELGESIHSGDLALPEGVRLKGSSDETIVSVVVPKQAAAASAEKGAEAGAAAEQSAKGQGEG
jgi:large subunit ribosomal protein L25